MQSNRTNRPMLGRVGTAFALGFVVTTAAAGAQPAPEPNPPATTPATAPAPRTILAPASAPQSTPTSGEMPKTAPAPTSAQPKSSDPTTMPKTGDPTTMPMQGTSPAMAPDAMSVPATMYDGKPIDALANNPNGSKWLEKFARTASTDAMPAMDSNASGTMMKPHAKRATTHKKSGAM